MSTYLMDRLDRRRRSAFCGGRRRMATEKLGERYNAGCCTLSTQEHGTRPVLVPVSHSPAAPSSAFVQVDHFGTGVLNIGQQYLLPGFA